MTWAKFDDGYPLHPKMLAAGADGLALDVAGICYSNRFGTDGFIADAMLPAIYPPIRSPRRVAGKLVAVGRWERDDARGGYLIHDHDHYNPSSTQIEAERKAARERMRTLRNGKSSGNVQANTQANKRRTGGERSGEVRDPRPDVLSEHKARAQRGDKSQPPTPTPPTYEPSCIRTGTCQPDQHKLAWPCTLTEVS